MRSRAWGTRFTGRRNVLSLPALPILDDEAFARLLVEQGVLVMPGALFETPGFFRICLTATEETCERSLPGFAAALTQAATVT